MGAQAALRRRYPRRRVQQPCRPVRQQRTQGQRPGGPGNDRFRLPALSTLAAGVRFESTHRGHPWSIRLDGTNLPQAQGLHISPVGLVLPEQSRQVQLTFAIET